MSNINNIMNYLADNLEVTSDITQQEEAELLDRLDAFSPISIGGEIEEWMKTKHTLTTLAYTDVTTTASTVSLLNGYKISDFNHLRLAVYDGNRVVGTTDISADSFKSGYDISTYGFALTNYNTVINAHYVSDTSIQLQARQITGWSSARAILYGYR